MNKETILVLIDKEISELRVMTAGFSQLATLPQPLVALAVDKAENLKKCLTELAEIGNESAEIVSAEIVETQVVEKPQVADIQPIEPKVTEVVVTESEPEIVEPEPIAEPEIVEPIPGEEPEKATEIVPEKVESATPTIVAETIQKSEAVVDHFEKENDGNSVAATLANQPVSDIKRAISIGDRFRFQRELFGNNGELMAKTLDAINACGTLTEAEDYLAQNCDFSGESPAASDFMEIVKRKF